MIVKDEAPIIRRCLEAARPLIDYAVIVDTGSSDATIAEVERFFHDAQLEGEVAREPWRDFAWNRSSALALLRRRADIDYALMIDADDQVVFDLGFDAAAFKAGLGADAYDVWTRLGGYSYTRPQLIGNRKPFAFKGVLHEFLHCAEPYSQAVARGFQCRAVQDGARNSSGGKYERDARTLEAALASETDPLLRARYTFYLAQSWRDCGRHREAYEHYLQRAGQGYWDQEVYLSLCYAGRMAEALEHGIAATLDLYLRAFEILPLRAEALHGAARLCRLKARYRAGHLYAARGVALAKPAEGLFLADWIYDYGMRDEFAILAYWAGRHAESLAACETLLARTDLSEPDRKRIGDNAAFARAAVRR